LATSKTLDRQLPFHRFAGITTEEQLLSTKL